MTAVCNLNESPVYRSNELVRPVLVIASEFLVHKVSDGMLSMLIHSLEFGQF